MSSQGRGQRLRGRASECETFRGLISTAESGSSQVLVLRGEAGVGKTALLEYASELASGFRSVQVAGVQSDMELAFAGLHQLCAPLMDHVDELPEPQREALAVAFGRGVGPTPDRFLVGLAVLSLMAAAANDQRLLCVVDDAQWLDQVSVQTLAFVARRLMAEPVALVFAVRDGGAESLAGLPELVINGLSGGDARDLLESVMVGGIDPRVRDRIVAETRGIPLALLEVPRNVSAAELAGGFWNSGGRPSAGQIEESFVRRIQSLPEPTQRLLLVAAAEPVGDAALFLRAAAQLGIPVDALAPAEAAGVIEFGPRMRCAPRWSSPAAAGVIPVRPGSAKPRCNCSTPPNDLRTSTTTWPGTPISSRSPLACTQGDSVNRAHWRRWLRLHALRSAVYRSCIGRSTSS